MQTLTRQLLDHGLADRVLTSAQLGRLLEGSSQRRHHLVNRAMKAGELIRLRRGLYVLPEKYRQRRCHPYALAQMLEPGSYVSLETALAHHGWIPEAVYTTVSITPGSKSKTVETSMMGRFGFHPLAIHEGYFLELVARELIAEQPMLVASPVRALMDLVCLRKLEWQGLDWLQGGMRIDDELLRTVTAEQLSILKLVYKQKRMQIYLGEFAQSLGLRVGGARG